jgi:hypothetical protein
MHLFEYKSHIIYPTPRLQIETGYWKVQLTLRYRNSFKIFTQDSVFPTEGEAVYNSIKYGKELVDSGIKLDGVIAKPDASERSMGR